MNTKKITLFLVPCIVAGLLLWRFMPPRVLVVAPVRGPAVEAVYATGTVEPTVMIPIAPRISARIESIAVDEGNVVKAGDLLARLDDAEARANLNNFATQETLAQSELTRISHLTERGVVSKVDFERARSAFISAVEARKAAEVRVSYLNLLAPSDGLVIRRDGEVGELIPVNQPIYWLSGAGPLRVTAEVDEEDISEVKIGNKVLIQADAMPGQIFEGKIQSITPKGDPVARSFRVRVTFDTVSSLQIGMTAELNIIQRQIADALLVPTSAIDGAMVWVLVDGVLRKKSVEVGARGVEQTEVRSGLSMDDVVVAIPSNRFTEGMRVREKRKTD